MYDWLVDISVLGENAPHELRLYSWFLLKLFYFGLDFNLWSEGDIKCPGA